MALMHRGLTYMLLNILSKAVNAKPVATIDFILTIDKSRLLFLSFSSSRSIFFLCCLSSESPRVSFRFSTEMQIEEYSIEGAQNIDLPPAIRTYVFYFAFLFRPSAFETFRCDRLGPTSSLRIV